MSFMAASAITLAGRRVTNHLLIDGAEDRSAGAVEHFDPDAVAELHEGRDGLAALDRFAHAALGDTGAANRRVAIGHGTGAHDGAGSEMARAGGMGDQLAEIEGEIGGGVGMAELLV